MMVNIKNNQHNDDSLVVKELKKEFIGRGEVKDFLFRQLNVTERGFLYLVSHNDTKYYEVFKKRINKRFATYSYPSSNSFGIWAWTYKSYDQAFEKLKSL